MRDRLDRDRDLERVRLSQVTASRTESPAAHPSQLQRVRLGWLLSVLIAVALLAAQTAAAEPAGAQVGASGESASAPVEEGLEVRRVGGADRYETSLRIAREVVEHAGGSVNAVVVASGESWLDAAVGSSLAGGLDLPLLLVPPGGLRPSALQFLESVGVAQVFAIGSTTQLPGADTRELRELGITIKRIWAGDAPATALSAAELILTAAGGSPSASDIAADIGDSNRPEQPRASAGRAVVLTDPGRSTESVAAVAFAARARLPLLLSSATTLDKNIEQFLLKQEMTYVVVMSASDASHAPARERLRSLGIAVVQVGSGGGFAVSAAAADFSTSGHDDRFTALTARDCPQGTASKIGFATGLRPWDALSAAPLLARQCAPLLLTERHSISSQANAVLYRALHTGTDLVLAFGGRAAVDDSVLAQAAAPAVPVRIAIIVDDPSSRAGFQSIAILDELGHQRRLLAGGEFADIGHLTWSPQQRRLAFSGTRRGISGVFVFELVTRELQRLTSAQQHFTPLPDSTLDWSADGTRLAMSGYSGKAGGLERHWNSEVHVADMADGSLKRLTHNRLPDRHAGWAPDGERLLILRVTDISGYTGGWWVPLVFSLDVESGETVSYRHLGIVTGARWSPDGTRVALATYESLMDVGYGTPRIHIVNSDGSSTEPVAASAGYLGTWSPDGCCIAVSAGLDTDNTIIIDAHSGESRKIAGRDGRDGSIIRSQRLGVTFEGWAPDSEHIVAETASWSQGLGELTEELLLIDVARRVDIPLPWSRVATGFRFGGFSPDGTHIAYAASYLDTSAIQLIVAEARRDGTTQVVLDVTGHFAPVSDRMTFQDVAHWPQLEWSEYGISGVAR